MQGMYRIASAPKDEYGQPILEHVTYSDFSLFKESAEAWLMRMEETEAHRAHWMVPANSIRKP